MTSKKILQLSMALPLVLPLLTWPMLYFQVVSDKGTLGWLLVFVAGSGIIGGIPYAILALGLEFWMMNKSADQIKKVLLAAPLMMIVVFVTIFGSLGFLSSGQLHFDRLWSTAREMLSLSIFILIFGYIYVGIAFLLARVFGSDSRIASRIP